MRNLLALLLVLPMCAAAQLPDFVPTEGLMLWLPCDSSLEDASLNYALENASIEGYSDNPVGETDGAISLDGLTHHVQYGGNSDFNDAFTLALWVRVDTLEFGPMVHVGYDAGFGYSGFSIGSGSAFSMNEQGYHLLGAFSGVGFFDASVTIQPTTWHHAAITWDSNTMRFHLDGVLMGEVSVAATFTPPSNQLFLGATAGAVSEKFGGDLDDVGVWNRALTPLEILQLYSATAPDVQLGCTDPEACNTNPNADYDDGSCEYGCLYCGEGTAWDSTLQQCLAIAGPGDTLYLEPDLLNPCGVGTTWNASAGKCVVAHPTDVDLDLCTGVNDVLAILVKFGECYEPHEPTDTTWTCGDPLTYWDYDYSTVLIGNQCWFSENLRTEFYRNGESIPAGLSNSEWITATSGATSFYGENGNDCNPDCDGELNLMLYGLLYNGYAISDTRGICPQSWSVSSDDHWKDLELYVGMDSSLVDSTGARGVDEGQKLKSSPASIPSWDGLNEFDLNISAGSGRASSYGTMIGVGIQCCAFYWTSTIENTVAYARSFYLAESRINRFEMPIESGMYVRCIKD